MLLRLPFLLGGFLGCDPESGAEPGFSTAASDDDGQRCQHCDSVVTPESYERDCPDSCGGTCYNVCD